jgi:glycosyltransferase involved in cell wall biosynthesis
VLGFMGALDFGPNQDSLHWILDQIVPTLNSEWTFEVIGKSAPRALIEKMKAHSQVKYLGFVQDLAKTTDRWRALLAPNVSGSGTRIKIFEALSMGMPVFTTTRTLETMPGFTHDHLFASDSPRAWLDHLNGNVHSKASENLDLHDWAMSYLKLALNKVEQTHVS